METPATTPDTVRSPVQPVRVFIVNDHGLVRQGLRDLLEQEGFDIAGESGSAAEALRLIPALKPDIALLNDQLPDGTGIEVCRDLRSTAPQVKCLILTGWDEQHAVRAAVLASASGYVLKQIGNNNELFNGIRSAASGRSLIGTGVRERVAESLHATASASWLTAMTMQERNVLAYMARGLSNRQIGQEMVLPDTAVATCVSSVLEKLGFRRLSQLTPAARRRILRESVH
ncbi:response regulator transcription factor [Pseudarthrobacter sp. NamE5]|uniref:response regulator transcription factor n=1 Tax=Pseudarthrobacter sp. NamE5 TaxID=2576839 RepID=UPI00110B8CB7|nr:response regulator transcription factor [Pseudarthrobacter sp. NamE5]TLM85984.1 response regulator transcription factor [Pseudarthrobacter sp. NamE5]